MISSLRLFHESRYRHSEMLLALAIVHDMSWFETTDPLGIARGDMGRCSIVSKNNSCFQHFRSIVDARTTLFIIRLKFSTNPLARG